MVPQKFIASHARGVNRKDLEISKCQHYKSKKTIGYWAPTLGGVPRPLYNLSLEVLEALVLFEIEIGYDFRATNGYWVHTNVIRFRWKPETVE